MKILVSSKSFANKLSEIDFDNDYVRRIEIIGNDIIIHTGKKSVRINVEVLEFRSMVNQQGRRWDWVRDILYQANEQPVVLEIKENVVNVIFQY